MMTKLGRLAALMAIETPLNPKHRSVYVRSSLIAEIRAELDRVGFDWRKAHSEARRLEREASFKSPEQP